VTELSSVRQEVARRARPGSALALDGLEDNLGLHLSLAQTFVIQQYLQNVTQLGLTPKQVATLWLVGANPGVSQIELARFFQIERATMLAVTNSLTEQGLVERRASQLDRRTVALHITPQGETMLRAAKSAIAKHERALRRGMPREETAFLLHMLKRFAEGARSDEERTSD